MTRKSATFTILLGGLFMSFVGLIMRLIVDATGFQILFYRSLTISLVVIIFSCIITKSNPLDFFKKLDFLKKKSYLFKNCILKKDEKLCF